MKYWFIFLCAHFGTVYADDSTYKTSVLDLLLKEAKNVRAPSRSIEISKGWDGCFLRLLDPSDFERVKSFGTRSSGAGTLDSVIRIYPSPFPFMTRQNDKHWVLKVRKNDLPITIKKWAERMLILPGKWKADASYHGNKVWRFVPLSSAENYPKNIWDGLDRFVWSQYCWVFEDATHAYVFQEKLTTNRPRSRSAELSILDTQWFKSLEGERDLAGNLIHRRPWWAFWR